MNKPYAPGVEEEIEIAKRLSKPIFQIQRQPTTYNLQVITEN